MLDKHFAVQWPLTADQAEQLGNSAPPTSRLYADGKYQTPSGKAKLFSIQWEPFPEQPSRKFPLVLNTGRTVEHLAHSHEDQGSKNPRAHGSNRLARNESARCAGS